MPEVGLDRWSLFHVLIGIVVWYGVQHTNYKKIKQLQNQMKKDFRKSMSPYLEKLPKKVRKHINLNVMTEPLRYRFDIHSVLMVAFFWEILEMYFERWEIFPYFQVLIPGVEHRVNRLILDPIMLVVGYRIARAFPKLFWPAMVACVLLFSLLVFY